MNTNENNEFASNENNNNVNKDAIAGSKQKKQHPIVVFPEDKTFLQDLKEEFGLRNDMEAFKVLLTVATDHRFDGDSDRFEAVAKQIEESRTGRKRESQIEALKRKLAELEAGKVNTEDA